jgi:hypothetical protein
VLYFLHVKDLELLHYLTLHRSYILNKIQGKEHLVKDPIGGGVFNTDTNSYEMAKKHKKKLQNEIQDKEDLLIRVEALEKIILDMVSKMESR